MIAVAAIFACWVVLFALIALMVRNSDVYEFRLDLLWQIRSAAMADARAHRSWQWRYEVYYSVGYKRMFFKFWKPLRAEVWYDDTTFLGGAS